MKRWLCALCCMALTLTCAWGQAEELSTAASVREYLTAAGWDDYTARDADGDGFDDEFMISFDAQGATDADTIDVYCQCMDGAARVICRLCDVPADADPLKVYEQLNEFNANLLNSRWLYNEADGYVYCAQEVYQAEEEGFGAYAYAYMYAAATYVYSFYGRFTQAIQ